MALINSCKTINRGRSVISFIAGTKKIYNFVNDNPAIRVMNISYVNDAAVIRKNPKVIAINSAMEIDLTGQVCADSIDTYQYAVSAAKWISSIEPSSFTTLSTALL